MHVVQHIAGRECFGSMELFDMQQRVTVIVMHMGGNEEQLCLVLPHRGKTSAHKLVPVCCLSSYSTHKSCSFLQPITKKKRGFKTKQKIKHVLCRYSAL